MSAMSLDASDSGTTRMRSSRRPAALPKITGTDPGRCTRNRSNAVPS